MLNSFRINFLILPSLISCFFYIQNIDITFRNVGILPADIRNLAKIVRVVVAARRKFSHRRGGRASSRRERKRRERKSTGCLHRRRITSGNVARTAAVVIMDWRTSDSGGVRTVVLLTRRTGSPGAISRIAGAGTSGVCGSLMARTLCKEA